MATTIKLKSGSGAPLAGDLVAAEPALDLTNKRLYTEDSGGTVIEVGTNPSTIDINAGTIDGTVIGGSSAAAGTFTTFTSTGIDDNATSTAITIDSSQNVGIGTSSPFGELSIKSASPQVYLETVANGNVQINFNETADQLDVMVNNSNGKIAFGTNSTERMRIDSSGNVGIGATSPSAVGSYKVLQIRGNSTANGGLIRLETSDGTSGVARFYAGSGSTVLESNTNTPLVFGTNATERMRIDSSGNLLVGTTDSAFVNGGGIKIANATAARLKLCDSNSAGTGSADGFELTQSGLDAYIYQNENSFMAFGTNATERMRIDSSGNLLVGTTQHRPATNNVNGVSIDGTFGIEASVTSGGPLTVNRKSTDGGIISLKKDGTTVGSIGVATSELYLSSGNTGLYFDDVNNLIRPANSTGALRDNTVDLGKSDSRFVDIYATNATIQTSDANEKQDIEALSDAEQRVAVACKGLLRKFRWKSAVEEKGDDARIHFGIIAQDLKAAFEAEGLDAGRYAMFIHSTWTDEETGEERSRMGVRYSELLAFIIAAI